MFQDISAEHAGKTITMEIHPHLGVTMTSIHPCKHAPVMKKMIDYYEESGYELRVDQ